MSLVASVTADCRALVPRCESSHLGFWDKFAIMARASGNWFHVQRSGFDADEVHSFWEFENGMTQQGLILKGM
jgi:hypothetical protein